MTEPVLARVPSSRGLNWQGRRRKVAIGESGLDAARRLLRLGRLPEALRACEEHLQRRGPSAAIHCLMAAIHEARGDGTQAVDHYRRAVYLDADCKEALLGLARCLGQHGEADTARNLRARARRIEQKPPGT
jgi:chemotaxis protein methyltransferase WspC